MPSVHIAPYRQIASEIAERLAASRDAGDVLGPWAEEVIVPSRAMADGIATELLRRMPNGVAGLRLRTLEELARRVINEAGEFPRVASDAERRLAMRTAVRTVEHPMMESRGVAAMLERSYRDVRDSGIPLATFAQRVRNHPRSLRNAQRTQVLLRVWTEYERLIAQLGAIDPADLLTKAASICHPERSEGPGRAGRGASATGIEPHPHRSLATLGMTGLRPQLLAGFYDMTGVQQQLVEALRAAGKLAGAWVPSEMAFAGRLLGMFEAVPRGSSEELPRVRVTPYETHHDELAGVCAAVAALLERGVDPRAIGIVARSLEPYDVRLLQRLAGQYGFATTLDDELPLTAHRIGRGVVTLLRLAERGFPRAEVLELVRDGLRTKTALDVDAVDAAARKARVAGGTTADLAPFRNHRVREVDTYLALVAELEELTSKIDAAFLGRAASLFRIETEQDLAAAEAIDEVAALFRRASAWSRGTDVPSMLDALEHVRLSQPRTTAPPLPVVWAGDVMRFRGHTFEHLFVLRMQDDVFPQRRTEDPLVPDGDRQRLGVREIGDGREEEALLHRLLFDGTRGELVFAFAGTDGFGKVLRPSRYLRGLPQETVLAAPVHPMAPAPRRPLQLLAKAGTGSVFDGYLTALHPAMKERLVSLSPTQLEDFGECPQKFLLKHLLGVTDIDHPERELQIDHRDKGTLDHGILERLYRELPPERFAAACATLPRLPDDLVIRLEQLIDEAFLEHERRVPPFNRTVRDIERRATKRILRDFVAHDLADLEEKGLTPARFEYRFGAKHRQTPDHPEPFLVPVEDGATVKVEGTIDRIDSGNDGTFRIVDYKSGKALRHLDLAGKIDRGVRLQLALYAMAVATFFEVDPKNVSATIKPLVVEALKPAKFAFLLADKQEGLLETLRIFLLAILGASFPAFPNEGDFDSCKYCPVNHSCRTKHDLDERYAVQQWKDPRTLLAEAFGR